MTKIVQQLKKVSNPIVYDILLGVAKTALPPLGTQCERGFHYKCDSEN